MATKRKGLIENTLLENRQKGKKGLIAYINCGDPSLDITESIIRTLHAKDVDIIELGVPFPNSFTDGDVILRSHARALNNKVELEDVLTLVKIIRADCPIPIVLLAEYSHTVRTRGLDTFLKLCKDAKVNGVLLHCLPPLLVNKYYALANQHELESIFSLYPKTSKTKRNEIYSLANGFIYFVTMYGRTGKNLSYDSLSLVNKLRGETHIPLAVGFGIKNKQDLVKIYDSGADAAIIGSSIISIIEQNYSVPDRLTGDISKYIDSLKD